jgi:hypothetical protein
VATTTKFYRLRGRNVRNSTQLQSMANGMYLTDQNIPEGFAKVMVNYDIDTTGSCIRTKKGRSIHDVLHYPEHGIMYTTYNLGRMHLTDYVYTYDYNSEEINDIKDVVLSFGKYGKLSDFIDTSVKPDLIPPEHSGYGYLSDLVITYDERSSTDVPIIDGVNVHSETTHSMWGIYCGRGSENFSKMGNENIGFVSARTVNNAYVFDKKVVNPLGYPISTVLNNEIYAITGGPVAVNIMPADLDLTRFTQLTDSVLSKLVIHETSGGYSIRRVPIQPRRVNPTEISTVGFNMLSESPYVYDDTAGGSPRVLGLLLYEDGNDIPTITPTVGDTYNARLFYQYLTAGSTYQYKIGIRDAMKEIREDDPDIYETLIDWTSITTGNEINFNIAIPYSKTTIVAYLRRDGQTSTESEMAWTYDTSVAKVELKEYNLATAKGMISWMGCVGLYGVQDAPETIFFSDVEDPSCFPYPGNTITFDNEILAVHNYLDMLLVITTDSIYVVTAGSNIMSSIQRKVMTNIFIPEIDAMNAVVLKDQIFFKTDTQFYVLKPNKYTSDATDLKNFTNSTAVSHYTIHFTEETLKILNRVFRPITNEESKLRRKTVKFTDFDVTDVQSMVKEEEVHYVYTIVPYIEEKQFGNLDLHLIYNTVTRSYRLYLVGIGDEEVEHSAKLYRNKQSGAFYEIFPHNKTDHHASLYIIKESLKGRDDDIVDNDWHLTPYYNNYNYIDTGNVALEDIANKRFRELQMNIVNKEDSRIRFYTDVKIDGKLNVTSTRYQIENVTDPDDPDYGLVYVIPTEVDELKTMMMAYGNTALECEEQELVKYWEVDLSAFPDLDTATIKLKLWGKGRRAAFQMLCTDLKNYEITSLVWVYRTMNVR